MDKKGALKIINDGETLRIEEIPKNLWEDKEIVLAAVKLDGMFLFYASDKLVKNKEIVLEAVKTSGLAIQYADKSLQKDINICCEAIKQDDCAYDYISDEIKKDPTILKTWAESINAHS
jgi:hypothetical protein